MSMCCAAAAPASFIEQNTPGDRVAMLIDDEEKNLGGPGILRVGIADAVGAGVSHKPDCYLWSLKDRDALETLLDRFVT